MNKEIMMSNFDKINTVNVQKDLAIETAIKSETTRDFSPMVNNITVGLSSGTSGNRGLFLTSDYEKARWAGIVLAKLLPKSILKAQKVGLFLRANSNLYENISSKKIQFNFFDLIKPIEVLMDELNTYAPDILVGPPSMLRMIAKSQEDGVINIKPQKIISGAEVLDPIDEKYLAKVFGQKIHQIYQCTEGFLARTCDHGTIHLNEDFIHFEKKFLDKSKTKFFPIITDLERKSQPVVRYELNDILTLKKDPCPCGSIHTAIEQIEGRADDVFYFRDETGDLVPIFPDFIRRQIISSSDEIEEYRVVQNSYDEIEAYIKTANKNAVDSIRVNLENFFESQSLIKPDIEFKEYNHIHSLKKMKRVERNYTH